MLVKLFADVEGRSNARGRTWGHTDHAFHGRPALTIEHARKIGTPLLKFRRLGADNADMADNFGKLDGSAALHGRLTRIIAEIGNSMEFEVVTDYGVPGGQLDLVWSWVPPSPVPGLVAPVPVVGFEIEPGWQTRKHVKGDLLNLRDAGVALGIIVLAGVDPDDDSLRRFATALVNRPGPRILIWTEEDLHALAAEHPMSDGGASEDAAPAHQACLPMFGITYAPGAVQHTSRYRPLSEWLRRQDGQPMRLTFKELEERTGITLPEPCRNHVSQWKSYQDSVVARAIIDAGWYASDVSLEASTVVLGPERVLSRN